MNTSSDAQQEIPLWPEGNPANQGTGEAVTEPSPNRLVVHHRPSVDMYVPEKFSTGAAVLVCPGGGYGVLAIDHEGEQVAQWLNARGIAAFVLKYRCGGGENGHPVPLNDALRGMRLIRSMAEEIGIEPDRVGVMGFSAGGHLASSVSTLWDEGNPEADDAIDRLSSRPDFSILVYPVISMRMVATHSGSRRNLLGDNPDEALVAKMSTDEQVNDKTPPTFLAHASDDRGVVPANSIQYFEALVKHGVPCELHMYEHGGHGFGMNTLKTKQNQWLDDLDVWLQRQVGTDDQ
ncbi:alpha/beta hydrolase [Aeoliella sp. ICT_H6.2]|uniref:Alpha/beta hydrolase n=1 Tax=Aeoliella straminimaris TaxID=2954799 RepID=A0A9X2F6N9_9BACT|nr:alpha/beta hydrolase [Aeoliella straminimaris]MCO6042789.1 alpha/beta hydrolase [Aeoliella straminimaris]